MKRWWVLFFVFSFLNGHSQVNIDSLLGVWKDTAEIEKNKIEAINSISRSYFFSYPDSSYHYATVLYDYCFERNNFSGLIRALKTLATSCIIKEQYNVALFHLENAIDKLQKQNRKNNNIEAFKNLQGIAYYKLGKYDKSYNYFVQALSIAKENQDTGLIASVIGNIANIYKVKGKTTLAIDHYLKSLKFYQKSNDFTGVGNQYLNIGLVHKQVKLYNKALEYYNEALKNYKIANDYHYIQMLYGNMGEVYYLKGEYNTALEFYFKALKIVKEKNIGDEIIHKINIARLYLKTENKVKLAEVLDFLKNKKSKKNEVNIDVNLLLSQAESTQKKAILYAEKAFNFANESGDEDGIKEASNLLYDLYKKANQKDKALEKYELYIKKRDSLENVKAIYQFEYAKKTLADSILNVEEKKMLEAKKDAAIKEQKTIRNSVLGTLILIIGFSLLLYRRFKITKRQNQIIKTQKQQVDQVNLELDAEKSKVELKNKEIVSSINYAKKIQQTILPKNEAMQNFFSDFFVFYQPKDIVGGDFYWFKSFGELAVIATVDCTGHGVPGGFMSMMGSMLMDKIVTSQRLDSSKILKQLNDEVIRMLSQYEGGEIQDGMDIALCVVDKDKKQLHFSGARNGIMIVSNGKSTVYHADIIPVGGAFSNKSKLLKRDYKLNTIQLTKNDMVFMYTDGYYDQFGGEFGRSIAMDSFQAILEETADLKEEREEFLLEKLTTWKGGLPQIDDVLVMGFKV